MMNDDRVEAQILRGTRETGKTYTFDEAHDPTAPIEWWFQRSHEGLVLFVVFYSRACRWSRCLGCNLPSKSSQYHVDYRSLMAQVDQLFGLAEVLEQRAEIRKVIVSNNGSMFDEKTFSSTALIYFVAKVNLHLPNVAVLTFETRPEYVDFAELEILSRVLREGETPTELELAIGFEAFDDRIRNEVFYKGLSLDALERFMDEVGPHGFAVKCYLMQKPVPGMSDEDGIRDVQRGIDYFADLVRRKGVKIGIHLNPTYVATGTPLAESLVRGEYTPPRLVDVARAVRHARDRGLRVFIGLYDEGLAVEGGSFVRPGEDAIVEKLERFNQTEDYGILEQLCG